MERSTIYQLKRLYNIRYWVILLLAVLPNTLFPAEQQNPELKQSIDAQFSMYFTKYPKLTLHSQLNYTWWFNRFVGIGGGVAVITSSIDHIWFDGNKYYVLDDKIWNWNLVVELKTALPIYRNFGLFANGQFRAEPIPFNFIAIEQHYNHEVNYKLKYVYSGFNPSWMVNAGLYYDIISKDVPDFKVRIGAGFGYGLYDVYNSYRRVVVDGQKINDHIEKKETSVYHPFLSISGFF